MNENETIRDEGQAGGSVSPDHPARKSLEGAGMTLLDAAARLLADADGPMRCREIVDAAIERGLWAPGKGKTPDRTLSAALQRELKKGEASRFARVGPGQFSLRQTPQA